jgi:hypothetical protein
MFFTCLSPSLFPPCLSLSPDSFFTIIGWAENGRREKGKWDEMQFGSGKKDRSLTRVLSPQAQNSEPISGISSEGYTGKGMIQSAPKKN